MNMEYVIEATDIKKKYKGFELDIASLAIPKGFATALIGENGAGKSTLINIMTGIRLDYQGSIRYFDEKETDVEKIPKGFATALIGENGAGKSTLINIMTGIRLDYQGSIRYFDEKETDVEKVKERIGYTGPGNYFLPHWTVAQTAEVSGLLFETFDGARYRELCKGLGIDESGKKKVSSLSDGNRMKLALAAALARKTECLIMDEPASPLDPLMRDCLCGMIRQYL